MPHMLESLFLGLDSFVFCIGLGAARGPASRLVAAALLFGAVDAAGTAFGTALAQQDYPLFAGLPGLAAGAIGAYGVLVLVSTAFARRWAGKPLILLLVASLMSLDNVASALLGDAGTPASTVSSSFVATTFMALSGCGIGVALAGRWPGLGRLMRGGSALAAALVMGLG